MKMISRRAGAIVALCFLLRCGTLEAQETGHIGLMLGYPTALGVVLKPTDRVAVRTTVSFSETENRQTQVAQANLSRLVPERVSRTTNATVEIGGLVYLHNDANLHLYLSPMYGFIRRTGAGTNPRARAIKGSFGAEFSPSHRFSVFGETGAEHVRTRFPSFPPLEIVSTSWSIASAGGVILYFH